MCQEICSCCEKDICHCKNSVNGKIEAKIRDVFKTIQSANKMINLKLHNRGFYFTCTPLNNELAIIYSLGKMETDLKCKLTGLRVRFDEKTLYLQFEYLESMPTF